MRVRRRTTDERGVVALTVALILVLILAMTALAVDGSVLYLKHRDVRTANDAAALAAAWSCGRDEGFSTAEAQADAYAVDNVFNARQKVPNVYTPNCDADTGTVTVRYEAEQDLLFGPAIGAGSSRWVSASATAKWGGAGAVSQVAPLMLSAHRLADCDIPSDDLVPYVDRCIFWWDNAMDANGSGTWGLMNLSTWGVDWPYNCQAPGLNSYREWLTNGYPGALYLADEGEPTYVCADSGFYGGALNNVLAQGVGHEYAFPVNDPATQIDRSGVACPPECKPDKYNIIGFAWLKIEGVFKPSDPAWATYCSSVPPEFSTGSSRCLVALWVGFSRSPIVSEGEGENFGIVQTWLTG